ncbi:hypothetical protein GO730_34845 [Spirosoma sp. HMF3257]|uniref:hypothetical protein n=1 Tax=Spirosoma telluris TaxID=2183553 RepID=UPI0011B9386E|nr:hypothetical protein [Spirosoma telluris]
MKTAPYLCLITIPRQLIAQQLTSRSTSTALRKGCRQLIVSYGYGRGNLIENRSVVQIQAGYYVANRLLIGVAGSMMREWIGELHTANKFSAGSFVRYQFTSSRLSPFAQLVYQPGDPTIVPTRHQAVVFTPRVNLALLSQVRIEARALPIYFLGAASARNGGPCPTPARQFLLIL